jgi:hypothetical protein
MKIHENVTKINFLCKQNDNLSKEKTLQQLAMVQALRQDKLYFYIVASLLVLSLLWALYLES